MQPPTEPGRSELVLAGRDATVGVDVVLPMLHGPYGEDGTVQGLLELAGLPYVGAGVLGSAVGMDKIMMKRVLRDRRAPDRALPRVPRRPRSPPRSCGRGRRRARLPVLREAVEHGLLGRCLEGARRAELEAALALALEYDEWIVAEADGHAAARSRSRCWATTHRDASLPGEIVPGAEFYDYDDKYDDGAAKLLAPAPLDDARDRRRCETLAVRAFEACRCEAMARVDFFYGEQGFVVNELNTIPGFTPISMYPRLWEVSGLPYPRLLDRLIELAIERHAAAPGGAAASADRATTR